MEANSTSSNLQENQIFTILRGVRTPQDLENKVNDIESNKVSQEAFKVFAAAHASLIEHSPLLKGIKVKIDLASAVPEQNSGRGVLSRTADTVFWLLKKNPLRNLTFDEVILCEPKQLERHFLSNLGNFDQDFDLLLDYAEAGLIDLWQVNELISNLEKSKIASAIGKKMDFLKNNKKELWLKLQSPPIKLDDLPADIFMAIFDAGKFSPAEMYNMPLISKRIKETLTQERLGQATFLWINEHKQPISALGLKKEKLEELITAHGNVLRYLDTTGLGIRGAKEVLKIVKHCPNLEYLSMAKCCIFGEGDEGAASVLGPWLEKCLTLKGLNLSNNILGIKGVNMLGSYLQRPEGLEILDLSNCHLYSSFDSFEFPIEKMTGLKELNLSNNHLANQIPKLKNSFKNLKQLSVLKLINIGIKSQEAKELAASFEQMKQLTVLDLSINPIGSAGVQALTNLQTLRVLNLLNTDIDKDSFEALEMLINLEELNLSINRRINMEFDGLKNLFKNLQNLNKVILENMGYMADVRKFREFRDDLQKEFKERNRKVEIFL